MASTGRVVVAGSINADVVVRVARLPRPGETVAATTVEWHAGGKGANQAAAAAAAGGAPTRFVGCVGDREHGPRLLDALGRFGVDLCVRTVSGPSGQAFVTVEGTGENSIVVVAGANAGLAVADVTGLALTEADVAVAPLESPVEAVLAFLHDAAPARRILNPTPVERCTPALLAEADIVVVNEHEHAVLADARPGPTMIVTLGPRGVRVGDHHTPGVEVRAVDTTGAGDCFVGTLAARLARGDDLAAATTAANDAAARSVTRRGAMDSFR